MHPHNYYIEILVDLGIFKFSSFSKSFISILCLSRYPAYFASIWICSITSFSIFFNSGRIFFSLENKLLAEIRYVDFKYVLNESKAGKEAQTYLKKRLDNGIKNLKNKEKAIQDEEKDIIKQKKLISAEEYKKKVMELRKKVSSLQTERSKLLDSIAKQRSKARTELLKILNPIIKDYMKEKNIRLVLEKKSILLADENLNITKEITDLLNKKLKSIKLN